MKKALGICAWIIVILLFWGSSIIISNTGWDNTISNIRLIRDLETVSLTSIKYIIFAIVNAFTYLIGICLCIFSVILSGCVIKSYIKQQKNVEQQDDEFKKAGYKEV